MYFNKLLLIIIALVISSTAYTQSPTELLKKWNNPQLADTVRMQALSNLIWNNYLYTKPDTAFILADKLENFSRQKENTLWVANAINTKGVTMSVKGNYGKAIEYYTQTLKLHTQVNSKYGITTSLNNIGLTNRKLGNYDIAKKYLKKSLEMATLNNFKEEVARSNQNLGTIYKKMGLTDSAIFHFRTCAIISEDINNPQTLSLAYSEIGTLHIEEGKFDLALYYLNKSLKLSQQLNDQFDIAKILAQIGRAHILMQNKKEGFQNIYQSYTLSDSLGFLEEKKNASFLMYQFNKTEGNSNEALKYHEIYETLKDTLQSSEYQKKAISIEYEKMAIADSTKNAELQKVRDAQLKLQQSETEKQKQKGYFLYGILAIVIVFGLFIFNRLRITRKQKQIIEKQKTKVEEAHLLLEGKNKEILDSITYAKRLQQAILPPLKTVKQYLPQSFIYYQPKDIIAGDFYWLETTKNGTIYLAAADCTGHGVPGAMVSVVCSEALTKSLIEENETEPGKLLGKTREFVIERFGKSEEQINDGMDIALCSIDTSSRKLKYAGANNPLWIIEKGAAEVKEISADKQPVGKFQNSSPYTTHTFMLNKETCIYLFSDGFIDQFGGPKNKKFMSKNFKKLLVSIYEKPMEEQHKILAETFEDWKGSNEQIDDVCVVGVRV